MIPPQVNPRFYGAVTVSERGQIVIPAQARRDLDIAIGEKLLVMGGPGGSVWLVRAHVVGQLLGQWTELVQRLQREFATATEETYEKEA